MTVRLVALDLDGTALQPDHVTLAEPDAAALSAAIECGLIVVPTTGRCHQGILAPVRALGGMEYAISSNGAAIRRMTSADAVVVRPLDPDRALAALAVAARESGSVALFADGQNYAARAEADGWGARLGWSPDVVASMAPTFVDDLRDVVRAHPDGVEKIDIGLPASARGRIGAELAALGMAVSDSGMTTVEVTAPGATKSAALAELCARLGVDRADVLAIGDSGNDVDMIAWAGVGVAMGNAALEVLAAADWVAPPNVEHGLAATLRRFVLDV